MADQQKGIMALPETDEASAPTLSPMEAYDAAKQGLTNADPKYTAMYDNAMSQAMPALLALSDKELDTVLQMIQYLYDNPDKYQEAVAELVKAGVADADTFPAEYDKNFLATFAAAVLEAQKTNEDTGSEQSQPMQPPATMARGGIADAARMVASHGRSGDTMLAHITKKEADLLKKHGGVGTINPRTGLHEYGLLSSIGHALGSVGKTISSAVKSVGSAVKSVLSSSVGKIVATVALAVFLGPMVGPIWAGALANAGVTALSGGNLKQVVTAGVTGAVAGYGAQALGPALAPAGSSAATQAAIGAGATGTGMGLVQGKSIEDSLKQGLTSAAISGSMAMAGTPPETTKTAGTTDVNPQTGQVTTGNTTPTSSTNVAPPVATNTVEIAPSAPAPVAPPVAAPQPLASSDAAFNQALTNSGADPYAVNANYSLTPPASTNALSTNAPAPVPTGPGLASSDQAFNQALANNPAPTPEPTAWDTVKDAYNKISPSGREAAGASDAAKAYDTTYKQELAAGRTPEAAKVAADIAAKSATPGVIGTYGPMVGAGLLLAKQQGAYEPQQPAPSKLEEKLAGTPGLDLINANPGTYIPQNIRGIKYDDKGNIVGGEQWTPGSYNNTEVASTASPYVQPMHQRQAYPTNQYQYVDPYQVPVKAASGGIMHLADGGYTGGAFPQSPLTMDNGPRMAEMSMPVAMNTPGVAMNRPMQYAVGGIASLAVGGYPKRTGQISGPGSETSDSIPAMLSDGEFVMTAKAVRGAGGGSRMAGAKKMYALMHQLEKNAARG